MKTQTRSGIVVVIVAIAATSGTYPVLAQCGQLTPSEIQGSCRASSSLRRQWSLKGPSGAGKSEIPDHSGVARHCVR